jgi:ankyrin repeat protein
VRLAPIVAAALLAASLPAAAQVAPAPGELAAYRGLHAAAHRGDAAEVARLAAADPGALQARDGNERTPLHVAAFAQRADAIRALAKAGADLGALDAQRYDAVTIASVADDEATLALLLELGASAKLVTSPYDGTALIAAAHLGHDGVVRRLIAADAPVDHVNRLHWTALIEAIVLGNGGPRHQACVRALLDAKADTSLGDRQGRSPLQLARDLRYREIAEMLQARGAR